MLTVYPIAILYVANLGFSCDTTGVSWGRVRSMIGGKSCGPRIFDNTKGLRLLEARHMTGKCIEMSVDCSPEEPMMIQPTLLYWQSDNGEWRMC